MFEYRRSVFCPCCGCLTPDPGGNVVQIRCMWCGETITLISEEEMNEILRRDREQQELIHRFVLSISLLDTLRKILRKEIHQWID